MRAERKMTPKTTPRPNRRRNGEPEDALELKLEAGPAVEVGEPLYVTDPDEDGMVTFMRYM